MSMLTTWGYTLPTLSTLQDMLTVSDFNKYTNSKYTGDQRVQPDITAASMAIRNYCGWHVYPSAPCVMETTFHDRRVTRVGDSLLIQLPASYVTDVSSVILYDADYEAFIFEPNGIVKVYGVHGTMKEWSKVIVEYTAGLPDGLMGSIQELIAHRVTHALASSNGVQSETAGGVSITYSANWTNSARATALADDNKEVLAPYRIKGVF